MIINNLTNKLKYIGRELVEIIKTTTVEKLKLEAAKELEAEFNEKAKIKIKCKMRELELAKKCVINIQRELDDLLGCLTLIRIS